MVQDVPGGDVGFAMLGKLWPELGNGLVEVDATLIFKLEEAHGDEALGR